MNDEKERKRVQSVFLKAFAVHANVTFACRKAKVSRTQVYEWLKDEEFHARYKEAEVSACDVLEYAAYERGVEGVEEVVVSQGQLVYEYEPMLDEDGKQMFDHNGKPLNKRGRQVMKRVYSDSLLTTLLKARMPEKYREKQSIEHTGKNGGPIEYVTEWGGGVLEESDEDSE